MQTDPLIQVEMCPLSLAPATLALGPSSGQQDVREVFKKASRKGFPSLMIKKKQGETLLSSVTMRVKPREPQRHNPEQTLPALPSSLKPLLGSN